MPRSVSRIALLVVVLAGGSAFARAPKSKWIRLSSAHFAILSDASQKDSKTAIVRLEQLRAGFGQLLMRDKVIMPQPIDVITFETRAEYAQYAPLIAGQPISTSGFFLAGKDRSYIVLDSSDPESWRPVARQFALWCLNYNYPPTQPWFDEGFADYFSSIQLSDTQMEIGGDSASFVELLNTKPWLPITELFAERAAAKTESQLFRAESWIVMHYLLNQQKLPATGKYFALVEIQKVPLESAIQQAFGVSPTQFEQAVKAYLHSVAPGLQPPAPAQSGAANGNSGSLHDSPPPVGPDEVGTSYAEVSLAEAQALIAEMTVRIPERREAAVKQLSDLAGDPETDSSIVHRALAWAEMQKQEYSNALDELSKARELNHDDPWVHYYDALVKFEQARSTGGETQGLANMMLDLRAVLDWNPDFAEAYNMLALAQLEGGGLHAAAESISSAIALSPRNQAYLLNLAHINIGEKKWDDATALLNQLKDSPDGKVAATARSDLQDLPTLKKYGILPARASAAQPKPVYSTPDDEDADSSGTPAPAPAAPDRRKTLYATGKLLSVDCSQPPGAILKIAVRGRIMQMRTPDFKSLLLIGAGQFSCDWKGEAVVVNYKANPKGGGDLVSLEIH